MIRRNTLGRQGAVLVLLSLGLLGATVVRAQEVSISEEEFKRLDTFEGVVLSRADKAFGQNEFRRAAAEYDAFLLQFPKSVATPYAVLRKGRSLHRDNKRYEAIKVYTEVLDYFPNAVNYAGAALYFIGACRWENGEVKEALKAWAEMAQDVDYRQHVLAAGAINQLADNLVEQGKPAEAVEYYKQVAVDFRRRNGDAARYAIEKAVYHYIRTAPNEPKLREFYEKAESFEHGPRKPDDGNYWQRVRENIRRHGNFTEEKKDDRNRYYQYWARAMEGKHPNWDDFQIDLADFKLVYEEDRTKWIERLDQQFAKLQKDGDYGRITKWIYLFRAQKEKVQEYYSKLDFAKMDNGEIQNLMRTLYDHGIDNDLAKSVFSKIRLDKLNDDEKYNLERYLWHRDEGLVNIVCQSMGDPERGRMELLRYYHWRRIVEKGMPLATEMTNVPQYAKEAYWLKAEMFHWQQKWPEAIAAYQSADNPPQNLWRIAECYQGYGKREQALGQLREIENFFQDQAPEAALRIAYLFRDTGDSKQYVSSLRGVMKKYPASGQSSTAHQELERLGVKIGGGIDAE